MRKPSPDKCYLSPYTRLHGGPLGILLGISSVTPLPVVQTYWKMLDLAMPQWNTIK